MKEEYFIVSVRKIEPLNDNKVMVNVSDFAKGLKKEFIKKLRKVKKDLEKEKEDELDYYSKVIFNKIFEELISNE